MICPYCNTNNNPEYRFCMACGSKLEESVPAQTVAEESSQERIEQAQEFPAQSVAPEDFEVAYIPGRPATRWHATCSVGTARRIC